MAIRATDLIWQMSNATGLRVEELGQAARALREHDLFVRETKAPRSWTLGPVDAANLLAAVLSGCAAVRAADAVEAMTNCIVYPADPRHFDSVTWTDDPSKRLWQDLSGSLPVALKGLLELARDLPTTTAGEFGKTYVEYEADRERGLVCIDRSRPARDSNERVFLAYANPQRKGIDKDLFRIRRVTFATISALGALLRNA